MGQMEAKQQHSNQTITVKFSEVPWMDPAATYAVRDLFAKKDMPGPGRGAGRYTLDAPLAPLSSRMFLFTPVGVDPR